LVATTGFCTTSSSLSEDTLSESDPVAKKRDIVANWNLCTDKFCDSRKESKYYK